MVRWTGNVLRRVFKGTAQKNLPLYSTWWNVMSNTTQSLPVRIRTVMLKSQTECGEWFIDVKMIHAAPFTFTQGQSPRCVESKTSLEKKEIITFHLQPPLKCCNFFFFFNKSKSKRGLWWERKELLSLYCLQVVVESFQKFFCFF